MRNDCVLSVGKGLKNIRENRCVDFGVGDAVDDVVLLDNCTLFFDDAIP